MDGCLPVVVVVVAGDDTFRVPPSSSSSPPSDSPPAVATLVDLDRVVHVVGQALVVVLF